MIVFIDGIRRFDFNGSEEDLHTTLLDKDEGYDLARVTVDISPEKEALFAEIDAQHAVALRRITGNASIEERDTWVTKQSAALAIQDGSALTSDISMLTVEAEARGESLQALVAIVLLRATIYKRLIGSAAAMRATARAAVTGAESLTSLQVARTSIEKQISAFLTREKLLPELVAAIAEAALAGQSLSDPLAIVSAHPSAAQFDSELAGVALQIVIEALAIDV